MSSLRSAPVNTQGNLNIERIGRLPLARPPRNEQELIVCFIDDQTNVIATAVERARQEIDLVREYRTRLIADVVTGKLDVREAVTGLLVTGDEVNLEPSESDGLFEVDPDDHSDNVGEDELLDPE